MCVCRCMEELLLPQHEKILRHKSAMMAPLTWALTGALDGCRCRCSRQRY